MSKIRRSVGVSLLALLALPATAGAQPSAVAAEATGPLLKADLVRALALKSAPMDRLVTLVRERCVTFSPTARDRNDLRSLGASDELMEAVTACRGGRRPQRTTVGAERTSARAQSGRSEYALSRPLAAPAVQVEDPAVLAVTLAPPLEPGAVPPPAAKDRSSTAAPAVMDRPPQLRNAQEVAALLKQHYPTDLNRKGIGGTVVLQLLVDVDGGVRETKLLESSGIPRLDEAATQVATRMEFEPARAGDTPIQTWTRQPVVFTSR